MQDNKNPLSQPPASNLVPDIVKSIPVAAPGSLRPADDDELDAIMRDVSQDVKKIGRQPSKHHWFSRQPKAKAQPVKPAPAAPARPAPQTTPATAKPAPVKISRAPLGAVALAIVVTGGLIAAAYYAYK